ncbi:Testis-expressed sequence protein [Echinococcus granulosus]|nr:Testis-expressed sequence protein [Echinococcus granulosus]
MLELIVGLIILTSLLLICTVAVFCYISGIFQSASLSISSDIPYLKDGATFYYKTNVGSYSTLGGLFTETYSIAPRLIQCGVYYDDSGKVVAKACRSAVGVILKEKPADGSIDFEKHGFSEFHTPPIKEALYASFPHTSFLSIFIGIWKVLPLLRRQFKELKCSRFTYVEVYDDTKIHYIGILKDNEDFIVPEFVDNKNDESVQISDSEVEQVLEGKEKAD